MEHVKDFQLIMLAHGIRRKQKTPTKPKTIWEAKWDGKANDIAEKRGHFNTALLSNGLDHEIRSILNINPEVRASKSLFNII